MTTNIRQKPTKNTKSTVKTKKRKRIKNIGNMFEDRDDELNYGILTKSKFFNDNFYLN